MQVIFDIPPQYVDRISAAFKVETVEDFKNKIIEIVRDTVKLHEEEVAIKNAMESVITEPDLIQ